MDRRQLVIIVTSIGIVMPLLDVTIVNIALPTLERDLKAGFTVLQWVVNAYSIPLAVLLVTAGKLGDIFGRKRVFIAGLAIFSIGSALCALTNVIAAAGLPPIVVLLTGRVVQGIGGAALLPVTLAIVNEAFHEHEDERTRVIGTRGAMSGLGLALGPLTGGLLLAHFDWTSIFWINVPVGLITIAVALRTIDESTDPHASKSIDWLGAALLSSAVLAVVLGLVLTDASGGKLTVPVIALIGSGLLVLAAFIVLEVRAKNPLYDLTLFANRSFTGSCAAVFLLSASFLALLFFLTLYLQNVLQLSPLITGVAFIPMMALTLAGAPLAGRLMPSDGPRWLVTGGLAATGIGVALLLFAIPSDASRPNWLLLECAFVLIGGGMGFVNAPTVATATGTAGHEKAGLASGINSVCRQIGVALGIALVGAFITQHFDAAIVAGVPARPAARIERIGTVSASAELREPPSPDLAALKAAPDFPHIAAFAQRSWIDAFHIGLIVATIILALGTVVAALTLRKSDLPNAS